jgi:uncharacterized cofD-like protein
VSSVNESIVLVGGGGGVYRVARYLRLIRPNITTIQTVFDHGGHSAELRDERGVLPPGDIRQAILALADDNIESCLRELMSYRFGVIGNSSLNRATVGNILLAALTEINHGSLPLAIEALSRLCGVRGKVLPVSLDDAELCVELSDGSILSGEGNIDTRSINDERVIRRAFLEPKAHIFVKAYDALVGADKIVLCPGDLYTSLVPTLLVEGFADAVRESQATVVYCVNIMTKFAETHQYSVGDFIQAVMKYLGRCPDVSIYNDRELAPELVAKYAGEKAYSVSVKDLKGFSGSLFPADLVDDAGGIVRHHRRIASIIADL